MLSLPGGPALGVANADEVPRLAGTEAAGVIHVWQPNGTGTTVRVAIGRHVRNFPVSAVTAIQIFGLGGDDTLDGGSGRDVMYGEIGSNLYISQDRSRDWIFALDPATNFVQGDVGRDILYHASLLPDVAATPRRHHH